MSAVLISIFNLHLFFSPAARTGKAHETSLVVEVHRKALVVLALCLFERAITFNGVACHRSLPTLSVPL